MAILVGMDKENDLGPLLVADFIFNYFMGAIFEGLVVGVFAFNAPIAVKKPLFMVGCLGF